MTFVTRFAPSPTGYLHLGHAFSALTAFKAARQAGGTFLLRIEDTDFTRCRPEYEEAILEDLAWLGITWDAEPIRQSEHREVYDKRLQSLVDRQIVYRCFRSRKEREEIANAPHGDMPGPFKGAVLSALEERAHLAEGKPFSWRLSIEAAQKALGFDLKELTFTEEMDKTTVEVSADVARFDGVVLGRKDIGTSYHLASVHDDADAGVTHVVRGDDLREAAGLHRLLYALFDKPAPIYRHHRLIVNEEGKRLSKRDKSASLRALRSGGVSPQEVERMVGFNVTV